MENALLPRSLLRLTCASMAGLLLTASAAELLIGKATAPAGTAVAVPVSVKAASGAVAAQFDVTFDPARVALTDVTAGTALAGHVVDHERLGSGHWRALVYSPSNAPLAAGPVIWMAFDVLPNAPDGDVPLGLSDALMSQPGGQAVQPLAQIGGAIAVSSAADILTIETGGEGELLARIVGVPGRVLTFQGTPDLFHWADLNILTNTSGTLVVPIDTSGDRGAYFYRTIPRQLAAAPAVPGPRLDAVRMLADEQVRFEVHSLPGDVWRIEGSPDLMHWGDYGVRTNLGVAVAVTNAPFGNPPRYYYRAAGP